MRRIIKNLVLDCFVLFILLPVLNAQTLETLDKKNNQTNLPIKTTPTIIGQHDHFGQSWGGANNSFGLSIANTGTGDGIRAYTGSKMKYSAGVFGASKNANGTVFGVYGITDSYQPGAAGVKGLATALTGMASGVIGETESNANGATGILGSAKSLSGKSCGVYGITNSSSDTSSGVKGISMSREGTTFGVYGITESSSDYTSGVNGLAKNNSGKTFGVTGVTNSETHGAAGIFGNALGSHGKIYGVLGSTQSKNPDAAAGYFVVESNDGEATALIAETKASNGYAIKALGNAYIKGKVTWKPVKSYLALSTAAFRPAQIYKNILVKEKKENPTEWGPIEDFKVFHQWYNTGTLLIVPTMLSKPSLLFHANVALPHDSDIKKITCCWNNNNSTSIASVKLYGVILGGSRSSADLIAELKTNGNNSNIVYKVSSQELFETVNNAEVIYFVELDLPPKIEFHGVIIEYETYTPY